MRYLICILAGLFLMSCQEDFASGPTKSPADAGKAMVALISQSQSFNRIPQQCPLSVYQTRQNTGGDAPDCARNPSACLAQCEAGNANACFFAARTVEKGNVENRSDSTFPLFMAACEFGIANACVNASATVKNGQWRQARPAAVATAQCQFQTYDRMCKDGAVWGCYMVAQEYLRSDGFRPRSESRYEANMRLACQINSTSGACQDRFND